MDPLQVHKNGKIFLLLDTEIGAVGHCASMAILPAGALHINFFFALLMFSKNVKSDASKPICPKIIRWGDYIRNFECYGKKI